MEFQERHLQPQLPQLQRPKQQYHQNQHQQLPLQLLQSEQQQKILLSRNIARKLLSPLWKISVAQR